MSWTALSQGNPALARFGEERFSTGVAYLATVRKDGSPRVYPVTPIIGEGRLFLFMEPTSPKGRDLRRDGRYALHSSVNDSGGGGGEFFVSGEATFVEDPDVRRLAARSASYDPAERYVLFELNLRQAMSTTYRDGEPLRDRWLPTKITEGRTK